MPFLIIAQEFSHLAFEITLLLKPWKKHLNELLDSTFMQVLQHILALFFSTGNVEETLPKVKHSSTSKVNFPQGKPEQIQDCQTHQQQKWSMELCLWFCHNHFYKSLFEDVNSKGLTDLWCQGWVPNPPNADSFRPLAFWGLGFGKVKAPLRKPRHQHLLVRDPLNSKPHVSQETANYHTRLCHGLHHLLRCMGSGSAADRR